MIEVSRDNLRGLLKPEISTSGESSRSFLVSIFWQRRRRRSGKSHLRRRFKPGECCKERYWHSTNAEQDAKNVAMSRSLLIGHDAEVEKRLQKILMRIEVWSTGYSINPEKA